MAEEAKAAAPPAAEVNDGKPLPKVFERFDGGDLPGFLRVWKDEVPEKIDIRKIAEESELSEEQLKVLKDAFDIFDSDKKGAITEEVVKTILELFTGEEVDDDELDELMEDYDVDESGEIEFEEFIELAEHFVEPEPDVREVKKELREVFVMYDKSKRGYIPAAEFKGILKQIDPEVPENDLEEIVKEIDSDCSGTIDFEEFMEVMLGEEEKTK